MKGANIEGTGVWRDGKAPTVNEANNIKKRICFGAA